MYAVDELVSVENAERTTAVNIRPKKVIRKFREPGPKADDAVPLI